MSADSGGRVSPALNEPFSISERSRSAIWNHIGHRPVIEVALIPPHGRIVTTSFLAQHLSGSLFTLWSCTARKSVYALHPARLDANAVQFLAPADVAGMLSPATS
jgi:hypothetical protein